MNLPRSWVLFAALFFSGLAPVWAATHSVTVSNFTFTPRSLTINAGDTVTFTNAGGGHNVRSDDQTSFRCAQGCDGNGGNGNISSALWSFTRTFSTPGTVGYYCEAHGSPNGSGMAGSIIVNAVTPPPPTIALGGYLSGNWFIPGQGGHGFQLELTSHVNASGKPDMLAIWFVYTPTGSTANDGSGQNWIYSEGDYDTTGGTVTLPAILLTGAKFPPNFNSADVRTIGTGPNPPNLWGHIKFTFSDCNNGTVSWHSDVPGYNDVTTNDKSFAIQRLTQIAGTTCPQ